MQLFFLLLITGAYVPEAIKIVISGANFALNPFESISFLESKNYNFMLRKLKYNINNSSLEVCELKSLSTVYNTFSFVIFIIYIIIVHVLIFVLRKILLNYQSTGKWRRLINVLKIFILKSYNILTFSLYIRMILEINEYFLISSLNEIYSFSAEHGDLIFSFIFSIFIILFSILLILLTIYLAFSSYQVDEESQNKLGEFFDGLKTSRICKMYPSLLLIRRLIFVVFWIVLQSAPSRVPIGILLPFQIGYLTLIAYSRPHQELIVNIVEIINESFFIWLLGSLLIFNEERDWFEAIIYIFMHLILINVIICFFILQGNYILLII